MKITYDWIKKYIDLDIPAEDVAHALTMSGSEVGSMERSGEDMIMELEITANRPDCLNMIGMAREASAVLDRDLVLPDLSVKEESKGPGINCEIKEEELCPRYTARVITDVSVKSLPEELKKYIISVGMREVNNIVDITNYCLMETGQPMHAFDMDKIDGDTIIVRKAKKGEKIITIDDIERDLEESMLVIADKSGPIAIAGVMGGKNTEVTEKTRNILLESAYFDPLSVRRTARKLGLTTDSSYRFERGVDKGMIVPASNRAGSLINKYAGGKINGFFDIGKCAPEERIIELDIKKTEKLLGISLEKERVKKILCRLGMELMRDDEHQLTVKPPSFREDIKIEVDLVEEIGRIFGYDNIPEKVERIVPQIVRKEYPRRVREKVGSVLAGAGLNEIMTYSLVNEKAVSSFPDFNKNVVELWNPLSEEHKYLAPQILNGMMRSISWNINRNNKDLGLFEIAKTYNELPKEGYAETYVLCVGMTGLLRKNWQEENREAGFFDIKGIIEILFKKLHLEVEFRKTDIGGFLNSTAIHINGGEDRIGFIGEAGPGLLRSYAVEQKVLLAHMDLDRITEKTVLDNKYQPIPKFPFATRDISIVCDRSMNVGDVEKTILKSDEKKVQSVEIISVYEGSPIPENKRSVSFSVEYGDPEATLKDEEIEEAHAKICKLITEKLDIEFR